MENVSAFNFQQDPGYEVNDLDSKDTQTEFHWVVEEYLEAEYDENRLRTIRAMLESENFYANVLKPQKENLFEIVCKINPESYTNRYLKMYRLLDIFITHGIDLNDRNKSGETLLMLACKNGRIDIVRSLLDLGSHRFVLDIYAVDNSGETALMKAKRNNDSKIVAALLGKKLISAFEYEKEDSVRSMLDELNNVSDIFVKSWSFNQDQDEMNREKENKFEIWSGAMYIALETATKSRSSYPCYVQGNKFGIWKDTKYIAMEKIRKRSDEILKLLLNFDVISSVEAELGCPILHRLIDFLDYEDKGDDGKNLRLIEMLLKSGKINVNATDERGMTALHWAAKEEFNSLLIRYGADVNKKDNEGKTPLMNMCFCRHKVYTILEEAGTVMDLDPVGSNGRTALIIAVMRQHSDAVKLLLNAGATVNLSDHLGFTALHHVLHGNIINDEEFPRNYEEFKKRKEIFTIIFDAENTHFRRDLYTRDAEWNEEREKIVKVLLQRPDLDVNALCFEKFSPLDMAEVWIPEIPSSVKTALKKKGALLNVFRQTETHSPSDFYLDVRCRLTLQRVVYQEYCQGYQDQEYDLEYQHFLEMKFRALINAFKEQIVSGKDQQGRTALHLTAMFFYIFSQVFRYYGDGLGNKIVQQLISIGCNVNETDIFGRIPLHYANYILKNLLRHYGADESIQDKNGNSSVDKTPPQASTKTFDIVRAVMARNEKRYILRPMNNKEMTINVQCIDSDDREFWLEEVDFKTAPRLIWEEYKYAFRHPIVEQITIEVIDLMSAIAKEIERLDQRFEIRVVSVGSSNEGTKLDEPNEFDFCFVLTKISERCEVSQSPELPTGFVRLKRKPTNECEESDFDGLFRKDGNLNTKKLNWQFAIIFLSALVNIESQQSSEWIIESPVRDISADVKKVLSIRIINPLNSASVKTISIDIVPCIHVDGWWADEAISNVSDDIKKFGCHLVFDAPQSLYPWVPYSESCARISFAKAESDTIKHSCDNSREAYMIGKTMTEGLKSNYILKNSLLYCIESLTPTFEKAFQLGLSLEELESKFHQMDRYVWLKCLIKCHLEFVSQDFCPCYFLPKFSSPIAKEHLKQTSLVWKNGCKSRFPFSCEIAYGLYRCTSNDISSESCYQLPTPNPLWEHFDRGQLIASLCEIAYKQFKIPI